MSEFEELRNKYPQFAFNDEPNKRDKNHSLLMIEAYNIIPNNYNPDVMKLYKKCYTWNRKFYKKYKNNDEINIDLMNGFPLFDNYANLDTFIPFEEKIKGVSLICRYRNPDNIKGSLVKYRYEIFNSLNIIKHCYGKVPYLVSYYKGPIGEGKESYPSSLSKLKVLNKYCFNLCLENYTEEMYTYDYITEKIYDCFLSKTIPIYNGCANIEKHIPKELFFNVEEYYDDLDEFSDELRRMDKNTFNKKVDLAYEWIMENRYKRGSVKELIEKILEGDN